MLQKLISLQENILNFIPKSYKKMKYTIRRNLQLILNMNNTETLKKKKKIGSSLTVQWLRLNAPNAGLIAG